METVAYTLQTLSPEATSFLALGICVVSMLVLLRIFGSHGITLYVTIAVVASNIQVLKIVHYAGMADPVAYGTIVFATTFLALDIQTEFYGSAAAKHSVNIGFAGMILMTGLMVSALWVQPARIDPVTQFSYQTLAQNHSHMMALFMPQPAFLLASLSAYYISQLLDITIFTRLSTWTHRRFLWLRTNVSSIISTIIDNTIFSILAWMVFSPTSLPWSVVLSTYILSTLLMRVMISCLCSPVIYLARYMRPKGESHALPL